MLLSKNRRRLEEVNCSFMKYVDLHETFTKQLVYQGRQDAGVAWLSERLESANAAFLSNEDFMGGYPDYVDGMQYPHARQYVNNLANLFPSQVSVDILVSVRSFAEWIESCYLQMLKTRQKQFISFEEFLKRIDIANFSWTRVLEGLLSVERVGRVHLFFYEDFRRNNEGLYAWLDGQIGIKLRRDVVSNVSNPSYSNLAYRLAEAADAHGIKSEDRVEFRKYLRASFNTSSGYDKPELFPDYVKALLNKNYARDVQEINSMMSDRLHIIEL